MKKTALAVLLSACMLAPAFAQSKRTSIKLVLGTLGKAAIEGEYKNTSNYWDVEKKRPQSDNTAGLEAAVELGYDFVPNLTFAVGGTYLNKGLYAEDGIFTHPTDAGYTGTLSFFPELSTDIFGAYLALTYSIPLREAFGISVFGGGGYYFGNVTIIDEGQVMQNPDESPGFRYFANRYKSKTQAPGFFAGASFDLKVNEGLILYIEGVYRVLAFKDYDSISRAASEVEGIIPENPNKEENTFMYASSLSDIDIYGDILYNLTSMNFKGLEFRGGMKIRF
jgi:hypothetical protein